MLRLLIATTNPDKLREIRGILGRLPVEILTLRDLAPIAEPEETGATFAENARIKALHYDALAGTELAPAKGRPCNDLGRNVTDVEVRPPYTVAEDSGLVIDALDGEPGVHSARFVRPDAMYPERFAEIYRRLDQRPMRPRSARFVCAVAVAHKGTILYETSGTVEGEIADIPRGEGGFGYDPIFYYMPLGCTLGEVTEEDKLRVAHRGEAFRRLAVWLEKG
jgi:XTP/dITP diphosphohydrolase